MNRTSEGSSNSLITLDLEGLSIKHQDNEEVQNNIINLDKADLLHFVVTFNEMPPVSQIEVTITLQEKGEFYGGINAGWCYYNPRATSVTEMVPVQNDPPRVELCVIEPTLGQSRHRASVSSDVVTAMIPEPWHGDPGPYDATFALTPVDTNVRSQRGATLVLKYDFIGIRP